jgi:cell division protein DivIC
MKSYLKKFPGNIFRGKIPAVLRNKYFFATAAFLSWMLFFDDNDIISQVRLRLKLSEYEAKKEYYQEKISEVKKEKQELLTNQASLEKFAREQYMMKKDNEDLFVIVPEKAKSK